MAGTTCSLYFFRKLSIVLNLESSILYLELNVEFRILYSIPASRYKIQDSHYTSDWHFLQILNFLLSVILYPTLVALPHFGQRNFTFDASIGEGTGITWPFSPCFFGFICFFFRSEEHTSELQSQFHLVCR